MEQKNQQNYKQLINLYEQYIGLLGAELKDVVPIAAKQGWSSKRLKQIAELRKNIAKIKNGDI